MATFVLIHGSWGGGWVWDRMRPVLEEAGHRVLTPTLTGFAEKHDLSRPEVGLSANVQEIADLLTSEEVDDAILVGHSYGGMVITGVADRIPDRIRRLVYIDAFVPENGESVVTAMRATSAANGIGPLLESAKNGAIAPSWVKPGASPPTDVPHPVRTFTEPLKLDNAAGRRIPGTYILTVDPGKAEASDGFAAFGQRAKSRGWTYHVLQADHTPERSAVSELAALLRSVP